MRLINTQTFKLEVFTDSQLAGFPYAILSHTWTNDEVTFEDMQDLAAARSRAGFSKIEAACQMAVDHGLQYVWVDTCCIDKSSSAELSEAMNSMFRWYQNALICYAFLSDLPASREDAAPLPDCFRECRWFKRGWTLQELIAPTDLLFYDQGWNLRGTKTDLEREIEAITGVSRLVLNGSVPLSRFSLAKRMSWAAGRQTTRVEDVAYCLLGIFDVNMPMIYGEGPKAFIRLQEEILKKTTDLSLFAWQAGESSTAAYRGILAESPSEFLRCGQIVSRNDQFRFRDEISMTNKGVKINTSLQHSKDGVYILDLHCHEENANRLSERIGIYLKRVQDTYFRHAAHKTTVAMSGPGNVPRIRFLASTTDVDMVKPFDQNRGIWIEFPSQDTLLYQYRVDDVRAVPEAYWHDGEQYFSIHDLPHFTCFVRFCVTSRVFSSQHQSNDVTAREETASFVLVCDLAAGSARAPLPRINLYADTGLQNSHKPDGFIDPFRNIEQYGSLGDPFSFSVLSQGDKEDRGVEMIHRDHRHDYVVSASLVRMDSQYLVRVSVNPLAEDENHIDRRFKKR